MNALRWLAKLFGRAVAGPEVHPVTSGDAHQRVFELRTRIHCGYY